MNLHDHFKKMLAASDELDEETLILLAEEARDHGHEFKIVTADNTAWEEIHGVQYATTKRSYNLKLGDTIVSNWEASFAGFYGPPCGQGFWHIDEVEPGDLSYSVENLLGTLDIDIYAPKVPEPVRIDDQ